MTRKTRSFRPSPSIVISCVALFLALTGTALAVGKNTVRSSHIVDGTVRTVDLRDGAVNSPKIAPDAVGSTQIALDAVGSAEIAPNAVASPEVAPESLTAADLAANSVGPSEVQDESLASGDLGTNSVGSTELQTSAVRASELGAIIQVSNETTIKGDSNASVSVACPAGTTVISGGARGGFYQVATSGSYRSGNGWHVDARSSANNDTTLTTYAYCLTGGTSN